MDTLSNYGFSQNRSYVFLSPGLRIELSTHQCLLSLLVSEET